ncbi:hypothetical protein EON67_01980 [archaeon]|nr:MAG: hypothetical protein EON67_01980 [archaeon]
MWCAHLQAPFYSYKMTLNGNAGLALLDGMTTYGMEHAPRVVTGVHRGLDALMPPRRAACSALWCR